MNDKKPFYITTTLPYVNAKPHVGHALEFVRADAVARSKALMGHPVFFNTGTDEHGVKIYQKAAEQGVDIQDYVDEYSGNIRKLTEQLDMATDVEGITFNFVRTTDADHIAAAQAFWKVCDEKGYIEKRKYKGMYCVSEELFIPEKDLDEEGKWKDHPEKELIEIEEENYFFKASEFSAQLLEHFEANPEFAIPQARSNEMKAFLERGLEDFSISRVKEKMPWGIPVPGDDEHVMYVWFDALVNYIDVIGWPNDMEKIEKWWPVTQYCGKDNTRQQSVMWQSMLLAAGLPLSEKIVINGFVTGEGGVKMSKSLGNVIDPIEIIEEYGVDALRYYLLREVHAFEDSAFTMDKFNEAYNANLANGIGNLASRLLNLGEKNLDAAPEIPPANIPEDLKQAISEYRLDRACDIVWRHIGELDVEIAEKEPYKLVKTDPEAAKEMLREMLVKLYDIARMLRPFLPQTSRTIKDLIKVNKKPEEPLFLRK